MEIYVLSVVKALTLKDWEVLLGIAWSTKEGRLAHINFPDIIGADVTYGDNNEKRPHICLIAKNQRNKNLPLVDAFLLSQQAYVFSLVLKKQFPPFYILKRCWRPRLSSQINVLLCVQHWQIISPSWNCMETPSTVYVNSTRCVWCVTWQHILSGDNFRLTINILLS